MGTCLATKEQHCRQSAIPQAVQMCRRAHLSQVHQPIAPEALHGHKHAKGLDAHDRGLVHTADGRGLAAEVCAPSIDAPTCASGGAATTGRQAVVGVEVPAVFLRDSLQVDKDCLCPFVKRRARGACCWLFAGCQDIVQGLGPCHPLVNLLREEACRGQWLL